MCGMTWNDVRLKTASQLFDRLFPITRSILGKGYRESLKILAEYIPFDEETYASGEEVFDWTVPDEWDLKRAYVVGPCGKIVIDSENNNLHVVGYSEPIEKNVTLEELNQHLHSLPELPDAIPYVTSYYKKNWGFCVSHKDREKLKPGIYKVCIDSSFKKGKLVLGTAFLPGESKKEVMFSTYLCHPSMANNELSGPVAMVELYRQISSWEKRKYSYRFLVNPETIGAISFLSRHGEGLMANLRAGFVLNCLGGPNANINCKLPKNENHYIAKLIKKIEQEKKIKISCSKFSPLFGSDERQYCSPGFDLPFVQVSKTGPAKYKEYHTSMDTKEFMQIDNVLNSVDEIVKIIKILENGTRCVNKIKYCEPNLGKRGLYPTLSSKETTFKMSSEAKSDNRKTLNKMLEILSYSDGIKDYVDLCNIIESDMDDIMPVVDELFFAGLVDKNE